MKRGEGVHVGGDVSGDVSGDVTADTRAERRSLTPPPSTPRRVCLEVCKVRCTGGDVSLQIRFREGLEGQRHQWVLASDILKPDVVNALKASLSKLK